MRLIDFLVAFSLLGAVLTATDRAVTLGPAVEQLPLVESQGGKSRSVILPESLGLRRIP